MNFSGLFLGNKFNLFKDRHPTPWDPWVKQKHFFETGYVVNLGSQIDIVKSSSSQHQLEYQLKRCSVHNKTPDMTSHDPLGSHDILPTIGWFLWAIDGGKSSKTILPYMDLMLFLLKLHGLSTGHCSGIFVSNEIVRRKIFMTKKRLGIHEFSGPKILSNFYKLFFGGLMLLAWLLAPFKTERYALGVAPLLVKATRPGWHSIFSIFSIWGSRTKPSLSALLMGVHHPTQEQNIWKIKPSPKKIPGSTSTWNPC